MAQNALPAVGTEQEKELFKDVFQHYLLAKEDLEQRLTDWDRKDELFRSHIKESGWPYNSLVFDPRIFTAILEKTSRLFANKPKGRMVPREGGDALGARINNELLDFQWDDNERYNNQSMLSKWSQMDMNCRKYGSSFALSKWAFERQIVKDGQSEEGKAKFKSSPFFDGPDFVPINNRDVLVNPSYSTVKKWFQHRDYLTLDELRGVNDAARTGPKYKNLDILEQQLRKEGSKAGDRRDNNYTSRNKSIKGLKDYLGSDPTNKIIEVITEYRNNRWITFAPKHGVVLRDIDNPYDHQQIPVVQLKYYPIDEDIYGLSEIEPVERLQKAVNALVNQYLDAINMSLYAPLKVKAQGVQMHTLEFGPGKKWIMNDPSDVIAHDQGITGVSEFTSTYSFMISAMQNALGETATGVSNISPFETDKTATEVRDSASQRNARDNYNQLFLSEAMKKQMMFWHLMNRQFLFQGDKKDKQKVIRIVGKDSIRYFQRRGLDKNVITEDDAKAMANEIEQGVEIKPNEFGVPRFPTSDGGPKMEVEEGGEVADLIVEPDDLAGLYDYIPDIESMQLPSDEQVNARKRQLLEMVINPEVKGQLQMEGFQFKLKELLEDFFEDSGLKDADKYFDKADNNVVNQTGAGGPQPGVPGQGNVPNQGLAGSDPASPQGQAQPVVPGSF